MKRKITVENSAKMIADRFCIRENSVILRRKNILKKLQCKNSAELIKLGLEINIQV